MTVIRPGRYERQYDLPDVRSSGDTSAEVNEVLVGPTNPAPTDDGATELWFDTSDDPGRLVASRAEIDHILIQLTQLRERVAQLERKATP